MYELSDHNAQEVPLNVSFADLHTTAMTYNQIMYTIIETATFEKYASDIWSDEELEAFKIWIARNPDSGKVIPDTGGLRKVRWSADGKGKLGGARVIYFNRLENGVIVLLIVYTKAKFDNLPTAFLKQLKEVARYG
jgi:hypothetical protein